MCLWWLVFHHRLGFGAAALGVRFVLPLHLLAAGALVLLAAGLGQLLRAAGHPPADFWRWTACGAVAAWFALVAAVARIKGARPGWIAGRSLASVAAALAPAPAMPGTARV